MRVLRTKPYNTSSFLILYFLANPPSPFALFAAFEMSNSAWSKLMALSRAQTEETQSSVQSVLIQRQQKEDLKRRQQEEKERKERELENRLRLQHFEETKKQEELKAKREREKEAKERERKRREEEERDALRYGPKKSRSTRSGSPKYPSSNSDSRRRRLPTDDDDGPAPLALTREEKRKQKEENELRRSLTTGKRSSHPSGHRAGAKLPGGAVNIASPGPGSPDSCSHQSVKARIAAMPNGLTKLNVNKRDTRTIDEILQDRAKARETKILDGVEAKEFNDWFGGKKKDMPKPSLPSASASVSSGWSTPVTRPSVSSEYLMGTPRLLVYLYFLESTSSNAELSMKKLTLSRLSASASDSAKGTSNPKPKISTAPKHKSSLAKSTSPKDKTFSSARSSTSSRKRTRSPLSHNYDSEDSLSPPPTKRRAADSRSGADWRSEIWGLFGKNRDAYVAKDVVSDDEDMEADADALAKEEFRRLVVFALFYQTER